MPVIPPWDSMDAFEFIRWQMNLCAPDGGPCQQPIVISRTQALQILSVKTESDLQELIHDSDIS
jgi:hypothetical protein